MKSSIFFLFSITTIVLTETNFVVLASSLALLSKQQQYHYQKKNLRGLIASSEQQMRERKLIFGGSQVINRSRYNYFALMSGKGLCGAVLISKKFVLTAAHCAYADTNFEIGTTSRKSRGIDRLYNLLGLGNGDGDGIEYEYAAGRIHPDYKEGSKEGGNYPNDIALFQLKEAVQASVATPIQLRKNPLPALSHHTTQTLTVIGFGDTDPSNLVSETSSYLREVELRYVPPNQCRKVAGRDIENGMMCAYSSGKDTGSGDSGGPLIFKKKNSISQDELVGIVSWGIPDGTGTGVYTRISYYYDWIADTICELNSDPGGLPDGITCNSTRSSGNLLSGSSSAGGGGGGGGELSGGTQLAPVIAPELSLPVFVDNDTLSSISEIVLLRVIVILVVVVNCLAMVLLVYSCILDNCMSPKRKRNLVN